MAEVGGLLASPVLRMAGNKLGSIIAEQANMQWNFTRDMEDMKETLETLEATLEDAEKRSINEKEVQLWLKRLKNAGLDIYDMFDDFHATMTQPTGKMPGMLSRFALASKMKNMRGTLRKIAEEHNTYKFSEVTSASTDQQQNDPRETTSDVNEGDIVGRNREKQEIIDLLSASGINKGTMILPIYGLGGIGKTTLTSLVFSDNKFKEYDHRVWVYVSQVFDLKKIGRSIISRLSKQGSQQSTETMESINRCLDGLLHDKILIVLDDIWEKKDSELEKLKRMLRVGKKGSMIDVIVTTREEVIARKISNIEPYKLQPLKEQMCWNIIKKISDFESKANKEQLREIGLDVAKKCEGVALAAQALGYTLRFKDLRGWSEVKDSGIWNELINDEVLPSLKLSYKNMPRHLRLCFVYCAIFPKGRNIVKDDLIHQWIALDLIKPSTRDGEEYIKQLLGMSFLQHSKLSSTSQQPAVFTMHDLVHDLARSVMGDELFVYERGNSCEQKYCRYALLTNYSGPTKLSAIFPAQVRAQVRALHFLDYSELELRNDAFSFAKCLRVLDLSGCPLSKLPECVTRLSRLQYLNLHGSWNISALPESIGKIERLIHLDLSRCFMLVELPESLGNLKSLLHLELSYCSRVVAMPKSFCGLTKLQYLNLSNCSNLEKLPEDIGSLTKLQYLDFSDCFNLEKLPEAIGSLTELQYLNFSNCSNLEKLPESWLMSNFPHLPHIVEFKLKNLPRCNRLPPLEQLPNLVKIELENLPRCNHLPPLGQLPNLEELHLERLHSITKVDGDFCGGRGAFRRLSTFALRNMERLEEWSTTYSGEDGVEEFMFPKLQRLCIWRCHSLRLKPCPPIFSTWLISDSDKVIYSWGAGGHISVPSSTPATTLEVHDSKVPKDKWRLLHHIPTLQKLEINQCDYLVSLPESMRHLTSLRSLELKCYSAVGITVLPEWMGDLTSLESLEIYGCNRLKSLPQCVQQLAMLKKIKITGNYDLRKWCESDENKMKLAHIEVSYADCDPAWYSLSKNDSISLHLFMSSDVNTCGNLHQLEDVNLNELQIYCLEDVRFLEEARKINLLDRQSLSKLTLEWTSDDDRILEDKDVLGELVPPGGLKHLTLDGYSSISFPTWLMGISQYLPNLVEIVLENMPRCNNLPPLGQLPNLEELNLKALHSITKIDGDFCGGRGAFLRLSTFCLEDMERLEAWNTTYCGEDGMEEFMFPKLDRLYIGGCPKLRLTPRPPIFCSWTIEKSDVVISSWSEGDHVSHSPSDTPRTTLNVWYSEVPVGQWRLLHHLPTLQELNIFSCDELTSLPENMQHLASLQSLKLSRCGGISALPEWLGHLTSLKILEIDRCESIKSLPQCIQQLTKLKKLKIVESLGLKRWCESEDNKNKLAHIEHVELGK